MQLYSTSNYIEIHVHSSALCAKSFQIEKVCLSGKFNVRRQIKSTRAPPGAIEESGSESIPPEAFHPDILPNISKALLSPPCIRFFVILRELPVVVVAAPAVAEPVVVVPPEPEELEAANGFPQTSAYTQSLQAAYINTTKFCPSGLPEVYGVVSCQLSGFTAGVAIPVLVMCGLPEAS